MFQSVLARLSFALLLLMAVAIPAHIVSAEVKWVKSVEEGMKTAAKAGKPVMLDFYAEW